jgi:hypothetical protein
MTDHPGVCRNVDGGQRCAEPLVAALHITVDGRDYTGFGTINVCLRHLLLLMVRHGIDPDKAVGLVEHLAHHNALQVLAEEKRHR